MKLYKLILVALVQSLIVGACTLFAPEPTPTPIPTATSTSTATPVPTATTTPTATVTTTATPEPTKTKIPPTATFDTGALLPTGEPLAEWEGIQIMPGAVNGEEGESDYRYTVYANNEEAAAFLTQAAKPAGWSLLATGESENGTSMLIFMDNTGASLSISLINFDDGLLLIWMML